MTVLLGAALLAFALACYAFLVLLLARLVWEGTRPPD